MEVSICPICSREYAQELLRKGFPDHLAVVSFYDPDLPPVDYPAGRAICVPLDDFRTNLAQAEEIARFIYAARAKGLDILCQCEQGRSRSAGCAAAILEHFEGRGEALFYDARFSPDQLVYDRVLAALEAAAKDTGMDGT